MHHVRMLLGPRFPHARSGERQASVAFPFLLVTADSFSKQQNKSPSRDPFHLESIKAATAEPCSVSERFKSRKKSSRLNESNITSNQIKFRLLCACCVSGFY